MKNHLRELRAARGRSQGTRRGSRGRPPAEAGARAESAAGARLSPVAVAVLVAWALLLLCAPALSNWVWAVNGFRSLEWPARIALLGSAGLAVGWARLPRPDAFTRWAVALGACALIAFGLHERIHFLGDTGVRNGVLDIFVRGLQRSGFAQLSSQLHAAPIDLLIDFYLPAALHALGMSTESALSVAGFALGVAFLVVSWKVAGRLASAGREPARHHLLAAALILNGTLLAFAGYIESAGVQLVFGAAWWSVLLAPLRRRLDPWWVAAGWVGIVLAHRVGLLWFPVLLWRAFGPAMERDEPHLRRQVAWLGLAAMAGVGTVMLLGRGSGQLGYDFGEILATLRHPARWINLLTDTLNLLLLIAPLGVLGVALAGRGAARAFLTRPYAALILLAVLPLLVLALVVSLVPSWMGGHREWDVSVLLGWVLSLAGAAMFAEPPIARARATLTFALPLLALGAGGWIAVNADARASLARVEALAEKPPPLADGQRASVYLYLGSYANSLKRRGEAARWLERSYDLAPTPNRGLLAAKAWGDAGNLVALRRLVARVRERGGLSPDAREGADSLEVQATRIEARRR